MEKIVAGDNFRQGSNRRQYLIIALLGGLVFLGVVIIGAIYSFILPPPNVWYVGLTADYPPSDAPYLVDLEHETSYLVNLEGEITVFRRKAPNYTACLFNWNSIENEFSDPCGGSWYKISGEYVRGPSYRDLDRYPVELQEGEIWVDLSNVIQGDPLIFE